MRYLYEVFINHGKFMCVEYISKNLYKPGQIVTVPFGKKIYDGIISRELQKPILHYHKPLEATENFISPNILEFFKTFCENTFTKPNFIVKQLLNSQKKRKSKSSDHIIPFEIKKHLTLNNNQSRATMEISSYFGTFQPVLLWGVTGSGKTEVFCELIKKLPEDAQILILTPEILLINSMKIRLEEIFNSTIALWNSTQRNKTVYESVQNGSTKIIIGARSAIFLPFKNLQLIIVDEEHDKSYEQTNYPYYHCKEVVLWKAKIEKIPIVFASATPSLESFYEVKQKNYVLITMKERYNESKIPTIETHKLSRNSLFNPKVKEEILRALEKNEQVMIYFNRRGFAPIIYCKLCYERAICLKCQSPLVYHKKSQGLRCHNCKTNVPSEKCPRCQEYSMTFGGMGIEKLQELINLEFPSYNSIILSSDYCENKRDMENLLDLVNSENTHIILGTQLVVKGHNFKRISLAVVLNMDFMCFDLYFREHLFQNLIQLAGRSGRGSTEGKLIIQTNQPDHWFLKHIVNQDFHGFLEDELIQRESWKFPPIYNIYRISHDNIEIFKPYGIVHKHKNHIILIIKAKTEPKELMDLLQNYFVEKNPQFLNS